MVGEEAQKDRKKHNVLLFFAGRNLFSRFSLSFAFAGLFLLAEKHANTLIHSNSCQLLAHFSLIAPELYTDFTSKHGNVFISYLLFLTRMIFHKISAL